MQRSTPPSHHRQCQHGAALLLAMLVVALVASVAAAATWQQWRGTEVETASRARLQSSWLLTGAGDWARLMLLESSRDNTGTNLSQPWAVPLQEARLSDFLAAERNVHVAGNDVPQDAFISGNMQDMQGRFNLSNLVRNNTISLPDQQALQRLMVQLRLPAAQAGTLAQNWLRSVKAQASPDTDPGAARLPQRVPHLAWLGLPADAVATLAPWVTILPQETPLNVNTASSEVLQAVLHIGAGDAQRIISHRASQPFTSVAQVQELLPALAAGHSGGTASGQTGAYGVHSSYFLAQGALRIGHVVMQQQSLLFVQSGQVQVLWRENGSFDERNTASTANTTTRPAR